MNVNMDAVLNRALISVFKTMKEAVGSDKASQINVSVAGGMYLQHRQLRPTMDADIFLRLPSGMTNLQIRDKMLKLDSSFTRNFEKHCGITWRDPETKIVIPIDMAMGNELGFMPRGITLAKVEDGQIPYADAPEVIKMKLLAAYQREDHLKGVQDFDDIMKLILAGDKVTFAPDEKKQYKDAFEQFFGEYMNFVKGQKTWSHDEWLKMLNLNDI